MILYRGPYLARLNLIACLLERDYVVRSELGTSPLGKSSISRTVLSLNLRFKYFRRAERIATGVFSTFRRQAVAIR